MEAKTLGQRIRELRLEKNLSLRQLAMKVGKSAPFISDVELGHRFPSPGVLQAIATELEVDASDLRRYDFRESLSTLKHLSQTNPRWGVAFRTTAEQIEKGLTPEELVSRLTDADPEQETP
ncbi:MAG: helix-turn-helix transcriptional regulator [Bryobacterales bacterium]|nr:helix-turn-helix transcriptional regulator [Bryobacterales bacterium]